MCTYTAFGGNLVLEDEVEATAIFQILYISTLI